MLRVFKYTIPLDDHFTIDLPQGARVLSVDVQRDEPQLWALVDPERETEQRTFRFAWPGHPISEIAEQLSFVSTFQMHRGSLIFHIFEVTTPQS